MKRKILPGEKKIAELVDTYLSEDVRKRVKYLLEPWRNDQGFLSQFTKVITFLSEVGKEEADWSSSHKKVKKQIEGDGIYHLNSQTVNLNLRNRKILHYIRVALRFLAEGKLVHTYSESDWSGRVTAYYYYKYDLGNDISIYLVKSESESDGTRWMDHMFSSENSIEKMSDVFHDWFWDFTKKSAFFVEKPYGNGTVLAPTVQEFNEEPDPFVGKFGPTQFYTYWQDFAKVGISRSLLFIGAPGTGKTTSVKEIASKNGLKLARIVPDALAKHLDEDSFTTWYNLFRPEVILIDDVHGVGRDSGLSIMLSILEHISNSIKIETLVVGTANKLENVDVALRRPGRFDSVFHFTSDGYEGKILDMYAEKYDCVDLIEPERKWMIKKFQNLTPAYMKEILKNVKALQHRDDLWEFIKERMDLMVELSDDNYKAELLNGKKEKEKVGFKPNDQDAVLKKPYKKAGFGV